MTLNNMKRKYNHQNVIIQTTVNYSDLYREIPTIFFSQQFFKTNPKFSVIWEDF